MLPIEGAGPGGEAAPPGPVLDEYPRGLHWFDNVDMGEALLRLPTTYRKIPKEAQSAHAECVGALARRARETAATGEWVESVRAWKALLLLNAMLNRKDTEDRAPGGKARPHPEDLKILF